MTGIYRLPRLKLFLTKYCAVHSRRILACTETSPLRIQEYNSAKNTHRNVSLQKSKAKFQDLGLLNNFHRKWYSKRFSDALESSDIDLKKIKALFPSPRMTLNNLSAKTPDRVFEVHYKQYVAPKEVKKKTPQNLDWTCTYTFVWPENIKFESTALSKRQAGETAATQALHWLTINKRIDSKGHPIYDKNIINEVKKTLNDPIFVNISENSLERVGRIWKEYESGIREIYERTSKEAQHRVITAAPAQLTKDSTIDEDEFPEQENDYGDEIANFSEHAGPVHPVYGRIIRPPSQTTLQKRSESLKNKFEYYDESLSKLPIDDYADQITSTLQTSRVTLIAGAAGCGKSTRVPAMVLRACGVNAAVVVSEPRRVAAIGLAERVASEMGEEVGQSVGYQVRLNSKPPKPPAGAVLFCTSGVLLNRLQTNPGLIGCSHAVIDEAHERDVNTDIILLLLKRALDINPHLKIIIMSATLDTGVFTRYFGSCPVIEVPGRIFPVEISYLEDIENKFNIKLPNTRASCEKEDGRPQLNIVEIVETIKAVDKYSAEGAILVFLPGWAEIKHAKQILEECYGQNTHCILPVHSRLSSTDQAKMFATPPPGVRKIVVATNVAETALTIPDVRHVIDTGVHRENTIREGTGTASLETVWVSLSGAKQRCGRAGRVQPGHCYRLYTKEKEAEFEPYSTPEILRVPLEQTVLDCKAYAPDDKVQDFLSQLPEPPSERAIKLAVSDLIDIGALTPKEQLTRLGKTLSTLQLSPRVGLSLVHASIVGTALAVSNIAAHSDVEVFLNAADRRDEIREIKRKFSATSDHSALNLLQQEFEDKSRSSNQKGLENWCQNYGVKKERLGFVQSLSSLYLSQLLRTGIIEPNLELEDMNHFTNIEELCIASLLSGVNGLLVTRRHVKTKGKMRTVTDVFSSTGEKAHVASESVNHAITKRKSCLLTHTGGRHSAERRALIIYRSSAITAHMPLLFCKGDVVQTNDFDEETTTLSLPRHKLDIHVPTNQSEAILKSREMLWKTLQYYIDRDIRNLDYDECTTISRFKIRLVKALGRILVEGQREGFEGSNKIQNIM